MTFTATVHKGTITLPPHIELPEGTPVEVKTREQPEPDVNALGWMAEFAGCIKTLPPDYADRHNEYIHGRKRRLS